MRTSRFYHSIRFQIIMSVIIALFVVMSLSFYGFYLYHRRQTVKSFEDYTIHLNDAMEGALEISMQANDADAMNHMIQTLEDRHDIEAARLLTKDGVIKISSSQDEIGTEIPISEKSCQICHEREPGDRTKTVEYNLPNGDLIMRSVNPIVNMPSCINEIGCHSTEERFSGMLMLDYSMQPVMSELSKGSRKIMLIVTGAGVGLFFLLYFLMNKVIFNKLTHIVEIARLVGKGDITQRIQSMGRNEISLLAASFNEVIQTLEESTKENKEARDYLTHLINSIEDEILVVDRQYRVVMANNAVVAGRNISREEAIGMPCQQLFSHVGTGRKCPDDYCPAAETLATGKLSKVLHSHHDGNGKTKYVEIYSSPFLNEDGEVTQVIEVMRDITERKHLEAQLAYSEKLSSVGRIAAGMAHEINNPIAAIAVCAEGLQRRSKDWGLTAEDSVRDLPQYLETIRQSAYRCKAITQKMLTFSRQIEPSFGLINPNNVVEDVLALVEYEAESARKNINLDLAKDMPHIKADESQLSQVFLNLIHNGLDAIDASGEITITTRKASDAIEIIFEDKGCGIAKADLQNIFEPFFTTKPTGKGTGLGLPISESIVRRHGGTIEVSSEIGIGTTFRVVLPIEQKSSELYYTT